MPIKSPKTTKKLPRNIWALSLTSFFTDISSEIVFNLLPLFLLNVLGVRTALIGVIEGIAETTSSLLKIFSGWLSDRLGSRKWLTVAGYSLSTLSKPLLYFANSWSAVLGVRFADRAGKGIRTAPRDAMLADSTPAEARGLAFGLHRAADTAGAMLGLVVAWLVVWLTQAGQLGLARTTFQTAVLISIIPALLGVLTLVFGAREPATALPESRRPRLSLSGFDGRFRWFLLIVVLFTLGNSSDAFLILRAQERGLSVLHILAMLITFNLIYSIVSMPAGAVSDRVGRKKLLVLGWLAYAVIYFGFARANSGWQIWVLYAVYGCYYGLTEGTAKAFVADLVQPAQRGTAYGLFNAAIGLSALPASVIAGVLWQGIGGWSGFGPSAPFYFGAALAFVAVALLVGVQRDGRREAT